MRPAGSCHHHSHLFVSRGHVLSLDFLAHYAAIAVHSVQSDRRRVKHHLHHDLSSLLLSFLLPSVTLPVKRRTGADTPTT